MHSLDIVKEMKYRTTKEIEKVNSGKAKLSFFKNIISFWRDRRQNVQRECSSLSFLKAEEFSLIFGNK